MNLQKSEMWGRANNGNKTKIVGGEIISKKIANVSKLMATDYCHSR